MTNIVTRKGLAFGALVALASTAIAGAPAHAAGEINLAPSVGTSYNTIAGEKFTLEASFAPGFAPAAAAQLKYAVTTDGTDIKAAAALTASAAASATPALMGQTTSATTKVIASGRSANTDRSFLVLQFAAATDTESVTVAAFADANNNDTLDSGEWSVSRTLGFKKVADVTATTTVTTPIVGDTTVKATINLGDLNTSQLAIANFGAALKKNTGSLATTNGSVAYNTDGTVAATFTSQTVAGSDVFTIQPLYKAGGSATTSDVIGSTGSATAAARTVKTVSTTVVAGNDSLAPSAASVATAGGTETATATTTDVRVNGTWTATATLKDAASTPVAVPGVAVSATVKTSATLSGTAGSVKSITVGGTTYTSNTANTTFATVALTSDASGVVSLPVVSAGLAANDTVTVTFSTQNLTSSVTATQKAAAYTITEGSTAGGYVTTPGATSVLKYAVKDQFGVAISGTYRVKAAVTGGSGARTYYSAPVAAGAATVSVVDAQTTTTTAASVVASLESQDSSTLNWSSATATGVTTAILYSTTANGFSTAPAIDATNGINNGAWTVSGDQKQKVTQSAIADLTANAAAGDTYAKLTFVAANQYQDVTVSGTGVYVAVGATAPSADKVTFQAASGTIAIYVAANTVGTKTITFTSGAETKTVDVKFASAGGTTARATAAKFAVAVAAAAQSGRAIDATVTVTDKWGNAVEGFVGTATISGVAQVNGGYSAAVTTDANGQATVKLSAGVNDLGDAVVTFSDNDSNTTTDVTSVAKTVTFGSTDGYIDVLNGKRASVTWSFAKGKRVAVYLDGVRRYNIVQPGDSELNLQFNLKKGSHSIKVVIGGVIVDTLSVKVAG